MVKSLSALLIIDNRREVRCFHPSFPDFITSSLRCGESRFLVSLNVSNMRLARSCLELLNRHLRYNMADLDDCDVANGDVKDALRGVVRAHTGTPLPPALFYAATIWSRHVTATSGADSGLLDALSYFCHNHLFHWLELCSLINLLGRGPNTSLLRVINWCKVRSSFSQYLPF
jgi:hypothetical protein